ncbi:Fic family protein [Calidifontibacillus oryziterrae]|uniref:Fic family protein n=1 Tax=Calidifontibacillus oryziterrae TaxID=1191699 RepID=UPI00031E5B07|nr:Fic family protein [Calidifontibacillus oryziterrae]
MRHLYKIFRETNFGEFEDYYQRRINFETTIKLPFKIKPINQSKTFQLYYVPTNELINKINEIYKQDSLLNSINETLPPIAQQNFIFDCLMEELHNTNDLEGVRSSKEEIIRSAKLINNTKVKNRFSSMISSYNKLLSDELKRLESPEDIRKIYNHIVDEEIDDFEKPDGELFRKDITHVYKKSGSEKIIHRGITPEDKIIECLLNLIDFLNNSNVPTLIKIVIGHYYFGYIHPFYDGNGRTSRFISSIYLNYELSNLTAISLSRGCNKYRNKYLTAFEITNSIANRGEMNCFIDEFLEIISNEQKHMIQEVKVKKEQLDGFTEKLSNDERLNDREMYYGIMYVLGQNYFFSVTEKGLTVKDLAIISNKSKQSIRDALKDLNEMGIIKMEGKRPIIYSIDEKYFEEEI